MINIDKNVNQILKDIVKAVSIFITQTFSAVTFHQILFSSYFTDRSYRHITIIFLVLFLLVFAVKMFLLINELVMATKLKTNLQSVQNVGQSTNKLKNVNSQKK